MLQATRSTTPVLAALVTLALAASAWADEYTVLTLPGAPTDPVGVASVVIGGGEDDVTQAVDLPFAFPYFGRRYDRISICTNGWAALGSTAGGSTTSTVSNNPSLPSTAAPDAVLAPLWDDLVTGSGTVRTYVNGTAPARVFFVDWSNVSSFNGSSTGLRFQIALHEGGAVELAYSSGGTFSGMSYTAGIEDPTGTVAFAGAGTGNNLSARPTGVVRFEPRATIVDGRLLRDRPVADATGLGNSTETGLAVVGASLRLVREDNGEIAAAGTTTADGSFSLRGVGFEGSERLALEVVTDGAAGRVVAASGDPYAYRFVSGLDADQIVQVGTVTLDASVDSVDSAIRRALNIHQAMERGRAAAVDIATWGAANLLSDPVDTIAPIDAAWVPGVGSAVGSSYTPAEGETPASLAISEGVANPDAYDDDVILRDYGQHVLASLSVHPGPLQVPHDFAATTSPELAWVEGFAYFFAAGVQGRDVFIDTISADTAVVDDLEVPPAGARGIGFPSAVAGSLWELVDPANETEDEVEGTPGPSPSGFVDVVAHVDRYLDKLADTNDAPATVRSFFDVWHAGGSPDDTDLRMRTARGFIHHGTLPDDTLEPNDRIDEASPTAGPGSKLSTLSLSPENHDLFQIDVPGTTPQTLEIVLQQTTDTDVVMDLLDSAGDVLETASNQGSGGSGRNTLRIRPAAPLQPGTYFARARSVDSRTVAYSLSVFRPLLLATGDLPDWTVGVPFKEDFAAAGGIEPYTFVTTTDAPGLFVMENGTRLTGVPTTAGTFDVSVVVSDVADPANSVTSQRPLLVNSAPTLPLLFGVAAGRDTPRVLGTGGTATIWTPLVQPPGSLTLVGGADLQLVGDSGGPAAFALSADALDSVGARLDAASTFVIVTADLLESDGTAVPGDDGFGYFLDALAGSEIDLTLRFRGTGETPLVTDIVDDMGVSLLTTGSIESFGRKVKLRDVIARETGRAHLLFTRGSFVGSLDAKTKVKPPRRYVGQGGLTAPDDIVEVAVDVLAGARIRIDLRRLPSPTALRPTVVEALDPDGRFVALPTERRRGAKRSILKFTAEVDGRYVLRFSGQENTTGPLYYKVRVRTPRSARLVLD